MLLHKPPTLSFVEAAGVPENWLTAFQALFLEGSFSKGENVLIHAVSLGHLINVKSLILFGCHLGCQWCWDRCDTARR